MEEHQIKETQLIWDLFVCFCILRQHKNALLYYLGSISPLMNLDQITKKRGAIPRSSRMRQSVTDTVPWCAYNWINVSHKGSSKLLLQTDSESALLSCSQPSALYQDVIAFQIYYKIYSTYVCAISV